MGVLLGHDHLPKPAHWKGAISECCQMPVAPLFAGQRMIGLSCVACRLPVELHALLDDDGIPEATWR